jgi:hypothetical protein
LKHAPAPPRRYGQRLELSEDTSPRGATCHCADKTGNISFVPLQIFRVVVLLLRKHRGAAGNGSDTTIKYLRCTTRQRPGTTIYRAGRPSTCSQQENNNSADVQRNKVSTVARNPMVEVSSTCSCDWPYLRGGTEACSNRCYAAQKLGTGLRRPFGGHAGGRGLAGEEQLGRFAVKQT